MQNALPLAHVIGPVYLLLALSILLYSKSWQKLLEKWENEHLAMFAIEFMYFILGVLSVNLYNVWKWDVWLLVTLTGWALIVKSVFYFLLPGSAIKAVLAQKKKREVLVFGGIVGLVLGAVLTYYSYLV